MAWRVRCFGSDLTAVEAGGDAWMRRNDVLGVIPAGPDGFREAPAAERADKLGDDEGGRVERLNARERVGVNPRGRDRRVGEAGRGREPEGAMMYSPTIAGM